MRYKIVGSLVAGFAIVAGSTFAQQPPQQIIQFQGKLDGVKSIQILDGAAFTIAQPPAAPAPAPADGFRGRGGDRGNGGGGLGRGMGGDPSVFFNMLSKGKDVINRNDLDERFRPMFDQMAPRMGITNGQVTRAQFQQAAETMRSRMKQGGGMAPEQMDRMAEDRFRKSDRDGDGLITPSEMPDRLKGIWEKYDTNKKGGLNLQDYKTYFREAFQQDRPASPAAATEAPPAATAALPPPQDQVKTAEDEDRKPIVYRAGRLPSDLPAWFEQLDTDRDGQIGLYEWVKGNRNIEEFKTYDRNDDGFITIEELVSVVRGNRTAAGADAVAMANNNVDSRSGMFGNMFGGGRGGDNSSFANFGNRGGPGGGRGNVNRGGDNGGGRGAMFMRGGDNGGSRGPGGRGGDNGGGGRGPGAGGRGRGGDNGAGMANGTFGGGRGPGGGRNGGGDTSTRPNNNSNPKGGGRGGRDPNNNNRPNE